MDWYSYWLKKYILVSNVLGNGSTNDSLQCATGNGECRWFDFTAKQLEVRLVTDVPIRSCASDILIDL
jgi:hypothetical protein